jgi:hypothetical protein
MSLSIEKPAYYEDPIVVNNKRWFTYLSVRRFGEQYDFPYGQEELRRHKYALYNPESKDPERCLNAGDLVISWRNGKVFGYDKPRFANFLTLDEFVEYLLTIPRTHWNFYEVILGKYPHRIYVDLEVESGKKGKNLSDNLTPEQWVELVAEDFIHAFLTLVPSFDPRNISYLTAHGKDKGSVHLIFQGMHAKDDEHGLSYMEGCQSLMKRKYCNFVDRMFKRIQQFRIVYSSKFESNRPLIPKSEFQHMTKTVKSHLSNYLEVDKASNKILKEILKATLVSVVDAKSALLNLLPPQGQKIDSCCNKARIGYDLPEINPEDISRIQDLVEQKVGIPFKLRKNSSPIFLTFDRVKRGKSVTCPVCSNDSHESNPYIVYSSRGRLILMCGARKTKMILEISDRGQMKVEERVGKKFSPRTPEKIKAEKAAMSALNSNRDPEKTFALLAAVFKS